MQTRPSSLFVLFGVALLASPLSAQQTVNTGAAGPSVQNWPMAPVARTEVAEACLGDLRQLNEQARQEGIWIPVGAGGWGWTGWGGDTTSAGATGSGAMAEDPAVMSPRREFGTLFRAAEVLAHQNNEQACQTVVSVLRENLQNYVQTAEAAGVELQDVQNWRQDQLLGSKPVTEGPIAVDAVMGADLRNLKDENLGSIDDVVIDPQDGSIKYVVVSRGGFLGIGEERYLVPWNSLRVAPAVDSFVIDVPEQVVENAPNFDPADGDATGMQQQLQQIDQYWSQHTG